MHAFPRRYHPRPEQLEGDHGAGAAQLIELLQKPDASAFEKAKACQRLAVVGSKAAIPALVALLPDPNLNLYARFGLEGIPDPAVDEALRTAALTLQGRQLVGVLDSIGQRETLRRSNC